MTPSGKNVSGPPGIALPGHGSREYEMAPAQETDHIGELVTRACAAVDRSVAAGTLPAFAAGTVAPPAFTLLLQWLIAAHEPATATSERLAQAIATACFGDRHLWQDLGLGERSDVTQLLAACFPTVHAANVHDLKWKRFLFAELATRHGGDTRPPSCARCDDFPKCFPGTARTGVDEQ